MLTGCFCCSCITENTAHSFISELLHGISESRVCEIIKETEGILIKDTRFHLQGKKSLLKEDNHFEAVLVDVTKNQVEHPKKQKLNYSVKKTRPTQKTQIIADKSGRKKLCTAFDKCRKHDFRLFKKQQNIFERINLLSGRYGLSWIGETA